MSAEHESNCFNNYANDTDNIFGSRYLDYSYYYAKVERFVYCSILFRNRTVKMISLES